MYYKYTIADNRNDWNIPMYYLLLLMEEMLRRVGCIKPCKSWDELPINWCRISAINSST